jgi:two-component system cell cycle response regulator
MAETPAQPAQAGEDFDAANSSVLVVDDNAQNLELLVAYLETLGCKVTTASDGLEALEKIRRQEIDLVLLDIMMPRMSGFEVCRKLKSDPKTREIPIIMVTALNELGDIERGVESGTDDFISKPVNRLELLTRVKSLLRVRHLKSELDRTLAYLNDVEISEKDN